MFYWKNQLQTFFMSFDVHQRLPVDINATFLQWFKCKHCQRLPKTNIHRWWFKKKLSEVIPEFWKNVNIGTDTDHRHINNENILCCKSVNYIIHWANSDKDSHAFR